MLIQVEYAMWVQNALPYREIPVWDCSVSWTKFLQYDVNNLIKYIYKHYAEDPLLTQKIKQVSYCTNPPEYSFRFIRTICLMKVLEIKKNPRYFEACSPDNKWRWQSPFSTLQLVLFSKNTLMNQPPHLQNLFPSLLILGFLFILRCLDVF